MAPQPLPGFTPLQTHHCITGSLRHIYEFNHYPISEDLLLGLGAGIGFVYFHFKGTAPMLGGRANVGRPGEEGMERAAGRRTGVRAELYRTASAKKAEAALLQLLEAGQPAMLGVDMGYLPYFDFPEEFHFGGHAIVVCGYEPEGKQVLVADRDGVPHEVTLEQLAKARGSKFKPFPPEHLWYTFDFAERHQPEAEEVRRAIREVLKGVLQPPIANLGVKGIRKAAQSIAEWPAIMTERELRQACFNSFIFIDYTGGTGGGCFRYMYGRFLGEAASIVGEDRLAEVGEALRSVGDRWQEAGLLLKEASSAPEPRALLPEAKAILLDVAGREQVVWERLAEIVGNGD